MQGQHDELWQAGERITWVGLTSYYSLAHMDLNLLVITWLIGKFCPFCSKWWSNGQFGPPWADGCGSAKITDLVFGFTAPPVLYWSVLGQDIQLLLVEWAWVIVLMRSKVQALWVPKGLNKGRHLAFWIAYRRCAGWTCARFNLFSYLHSLRTQMVQFLWHKPLVCQETAPSLVLNCWFRTDVARLHSG